MEKVKPIKLVKDMKVSELVGQMKGAGFGARKIGRAVEIVEKMFNDSECRVFMGVAGAMVPAGMKQIIIDLIRAKKIDVLVTTGANLTHDLAEALGDKHYHCDTWDDEKFNDEGFYRMYNVLMKNDVYLKLESFVEENWEKFKECGNIQEFLRVVGELVSGGEDSILKACYENDVKLFCPGLADSGIGLMIWGRLAQGKEINIDAFDDMKEIIDFAWTSKKSGVIYIGGGLAKNFIQQSLQFSKGADYGVQITTDRVESGGSSGAPLEEGKSWGNLKKGTKDYVDVNCDATIALPLIFSGVLGKFKNEEVN
jgi:deoxyhypusine synthase